MSTQPAWWAGEETSGGWLGGRRPSGLGLLPPSGRLPFSALARQRPAGRPEAYPLEKAEPGPEADAAGFATFPLANAAGSPGAARGLTRSTLRGWGLPELADDAVTVVSELVTNALRYGLPADGHHRPLPPASAEQPFLLSLVHYGGSVLCAVFDPGADVPVLREADHLRESGRGLHVLQALAASWGWTTPDRHGKAVWALLQPAGQAAGAEDDQASGGSAVGPADAEWEPLTRLLLLLELLSGPSWLKALGSSARPRGGAGAAG